MSLHNTDWYDSLDILQLPNLDLFTDVYPKLGSDLNSLCPSLQFSKLFHMHLSQLSCPLSQDRQCRKRTKSFGKGILDEEPPAPLTKPLQLYCSDFCLRFFHNASTQESAAYSPSKAWKEGDTSKFLLLAGLGGSLIIVWGLFLFSCLKKAFSDLFLCESFIVHFIIQYGCHQTEQAAGQGKSWLAKVDCFYFCNNSPSRHSPILVGSTHIAGWALTRIGTPGLLRHLEQFA